MKSRATAAPLIVAAPFAGETVLGESVAINGACLTVVARTDHSCRFQAGPETLQRSNLGQLQAGERVNLERALRVGDRLGGHFVQGHVDGLGQIRQRQRQAEWEVIWFGCAAELARQIVPKGSIAVDGISLTVVEVSTESFSVALIPHTLAQTTLGFKRSGASVNLEIDVLAKYVWKCLRGEARLLGEAGLLARGGSVTLETLQRAGFSPGSAPGGQP